MKIKIPANTELAACAFLTCAEIGVLVRTGLEGMVAARKMVLSFFRRKLYQRDANKVRGCQPRSNHP